jgi:DNA modification methylase
MLSANKNALFKIIGKYSDNLKEILIWNKSMVAPVIEPGVLNSKFEFILVFTKDNPHKRKFDYSFFSQGGLNNVIEGKNNSQNKWAKEHSAAFPSYFVRFFLNNFSQEGDVILDPFMGTGTSAFVSKLMNRKFIGFEINETYCNIVNTRIEQNSLDDFKEIKIQKPLF